MNYKDTKPYMSAFLSADLLTDFAAFCLPDFIDWRYIHSWFVVCIFHPACELLAPWKKELYLTCVLLPLYCIFSLTSSPLSRFPMYSILYTVCDYWGVGGVEMYCGPYSAGVLHSVSEPTKLLHHP